MLKALNPRETKCPCGVVLVKPSQFTAELVEPSYLDECRTRSRKKNDFKLSVAMMVVPGCFHETTGYCLQNVW